LLIAGALVLVGVFAGAYFNWSRSATGEPEVAPAEPTQVRPGVATPDEIDESEDLNWDEINHDGSVDLRVGDCFDLKDPSADQIEHVKEVPCSTEHEFPERAALLLGAAEGLRRRVGLRQWPMLRRGEAELVAEARQALGADRFEQVLAASSRLNQREAVAAARDWRGADSAAL
jgi:hypothetical protein